MIMKKHILLSTAIFSFLLLSVPACKKEKAPAPKTKTELISSSPWVFQSASASGTDISNNAALACVKDNSLTFAAAGTGSVAEGTIVCSPTTAGNFTWSFQNTETTLSLSAGLLPGGNGTFNLVSVDATNLVISQNVTIPPSVTPILVVFTFKH